jgi:hypothetical protein
VSRREIANVYLIVIASEAKQSIEQQARKLDCFASLAMTSPDISAWLFEN